MAIESDYETRRQALLWAMDFAAVVAKSGEAVSTTSILGTAKKFEAYLLGKEA